MLARLWGALVREPIPGVTGRRRFGNDIMVTLASGQRLMGRAELAEPFAVAPDEFRVSTSDGQFSSPAELMRALTLPGAVSRFADELEQSVAFLALARAGQPEPSLGEFTLTSLAGQPAGTARLEQAVVDGHPLHPLCRTRMGMSAEEVLAYAPEHRPTVALEIYEVPRERWLSTGAGLAPRLPVHPWQREHVLGTFPFLKRSGTQIPARPLMSLRTLASVADPSLHYKTALGVQMTSAVRIVSPAAVRNAPVLSSLLTSLAAGANLTIWPEPAAGAVLADNGELLKELAVSTRRATLPRPHEVILPIAALAAPSPSSGRPLIREAITLGYGGHPAGFIADLATLILGPLLTLLHRGIALEAHGQNLLITLTHGRPTGLSYRDIGGIRVSPARLRRHRQDVPPLHGDVESDDDAQLRNKAFASGITVALGEPIAVLSREYHLEPEQLWRIVREKADQVFDQLPPTAAGDAHALGHYPLPVKATTAMRLAENPIEDIWATMDNPLAV